MTKDIQGEMKQSGFATTLIVAAMLSLVFTSAALASDPSAKVIVKNEGFYRVTKAQIAAIFSMSESTVATSAFQVMNMGKSVPAIRDNGDVVFYAHQYNSAFTDQNVYWVLSGAGPAPAIQSVVPGSTPFASSFPAKRRSDSQVIFRGDIIRVPGSELEDPIFWRLISSGLLTSNFNVTMNMDAVTPASGGTLKIRVKGATEDVPTRYYHRARILVNNTLLGSLDFEGLNSAEATFTVPSGLFVTGNNTIKVQSNPPAGTTFDSFYLDFLEATYQRNFVAQSNRLTIPLTSGSVEISSLNNSNLICWNVSDPWAPSQLVGAQIVQAGTNYKINFNTTVSGNYAVVRLGSELVPLQVATGSVFNLKDPAWQLDHLTIAEPALLGAAQTVKTHRAGQGLLAEAISINDVYDSFNFGIRDPRAIQAFLGYAFRNWTKYPSYVFLMGDGSLDYKNGMGANDSGIPSMPVVVSGGMYASDYLFGDVDGDGNVEIAVGRLPVNAMSNATAFVQKMINYEAGGNWRTNTLITTDLSDYAGAFYSDGNYLEQSITDREVQRADMDILGATATRQGIIAGVNNGREVTVYIGHGTPNQLSLQSILLSADSALFTNDTAPSTFVMIGCLVGSFANPAFTGFGESMIKAKGGAASMMAAATLISAADGRVFSEDFLNTLYTEGKSRIGDAWVKGKNALTLNGRAPAFKAFQLLGDPGMAVGDPQAPAEGQAQGPSRGTYEEWKSWAIPVVLQDAGFLANENDDPDGDLVTNFAEYMAGTDALDDSSFLEIVEIKRGANAQEKLVSWPSAGGRTYTLEYATSIKGPYFPLGQGIEATAPINSYVADATSNHYFYRVVVE